MCQAFILSSQYNQSFGPLFQQSMDLYQTSHAFESVHTTLQQAFLEPNFINGLISPTLGDVQVSSADILLSIIQDHSLGVYFSLPDLHECPLI